MAFCQLCILPPVIMMVGIMTWQRLGCRVGVVAFIAVPAVKTFTWDYNSLFIGSVLVNAIAIFCMGAVSECGFRRHGSICTYIRVDGRTTRDVP